MFDRPAQHEAQISSAKVGVPVQPDWVIPRPRIVDRVARGVRGPLTVVTGPPGAGKTVAVMAWAAAGKAPGPVAWVSLDGMDHRPDLFWPHVVAALRAAGLTVPEYSGGDVFLTELAAAISGRESPIALVLDDFQPDYDARVVGELSYVVRNTGPLLRLILISRRDPPLPLHRYRLTGELTEIRADDLAFGEREIHSLTAQHGVALPAESVRALRERTEGWAAGLRLAAMSMEGHPDPEAFAAQFAGDDHAVVGYLMEEVVEAQRPDMRHLLLTTSIAERFDAELVEELAGADASRCFPALIRHNAFVRPVGHGWFRYHHMFGEALNLILRHEAPGEVAALHRRAAAWFNRKGLLVDAVRHAARAADWPYASWLIVDQLAIGLVAGLGTRPGMEHPFADILCDIPEQALSAATEPEVALVVAAVALANGDDEMCARGLRRAEHLLGALPPDQAVTARLAACVISLARSGPKSPAMLRAILSDVDALLGQLPGRPLNDHPELWALVQWCRGTIELYGGRLPAAAAMFQSALPAATDAGGDFQRRRCLGSLALVEALLGRFRQATGLAVKAAQLPEEATSPAGRRAGVAHLACAWVALTRYRLDQARLELDKTRLALRESADVLLSALCGLLSARVDVATGAPERAVRTLAAARSHVRGLPWLDRRLRLVEAEAHARGGRHADALALAHDPGGEDMADSVVGVARAQLCAGDHPAAARTLRPALSESMPAPSDVRVEAWLLDARLAYDAGDISRGRRSLDRALRLGGREQILLPFAMAGAWLPAVLRRDAELLRPHRRLLAPLAVGGAPTLRSTMPAEAVYGRLSARERDVLRYLSEMLTTEEIATEMYVSVNTVKTHLKSIYRKLAVTRRGEAVRRAHHLQLL